jgi:hypothetical protein
MLRKPCIHCKKVHNYHKDSNHGCRNTKIVKPKNSNDDFPELEAAPKISNQAKEAKSLVLDEEEHRRIMAFWDAQDISSSEYFDSDENNAEDSSDEEEEINSSQNKVEEDDCSLSSKTSDDSFHDDSTFASSLEDDHQPDLYDGSSHSDADSDVDSSASEVDEEDWTDLVLEDVSRQKFGNVKYGLPKFNKEIPPGPRNIPPATSFPVDFFQLYFDLEIMQQLVEHTNIAGSKKNLISKKLLE